MTSGLNGSFARPASSEFGNRLDIDGLIEIGRRHPDRRLPPHHRERFKRLIADGGDGRGGVLRVERHNQDTIAARASHRLETRGDRWIAVAHGPIDQNARVAGEAFAKLTGLRPCDGLEDRFVAFLVPDFVVVAPFAAGADGQDDQVKNEPPFDAVLLDHAAVGEKFLQIAAHRPVVGGVGRTEIDQQHADMTRRYLRMSQRKLRGVCHRLQSGAKRASGQERVSPSGARLR